MEAEWWWELRTEQPTEGVAKKNEKDLVYMSPTATMAFFSNLRIPATKATTLMLLFALVLSTMSISMAQEEGIAVPEAAASHSVHVQFCVSWGSQRNFLQVRKWLESNFPELEGNVTGENYPPPPLVELLQKLLSVVQLCGILFAVLGSNVFSLFGIRRVPNWYYTVEKSSVQIAIVVYL